MTIDVEAIRKEVQANMARLDTCSRHQFDHPTNPFSRQKSKCRSCGGTMDLLQAKAYERGFDHGRLSRDTTSNEDAYSNKASR